MPTRHSQPDSDDDSIALNQAMQQIRQADQAGDTEQAHRLLSDMLQHFPLDPFSHIFASAFYASTGEKEKLLQEIAILVALDPTTGIGHRRLASVLMRKGEQDLATHILEIGWQNQATNNKTELDRQRYFNIGDGD